MTDPSSPSCLAGLRVLDLSRVLAGPWAGQILGDLGAEVIKVEKPGEGDDTRSWGPPFLRDRDGAPTGETAYFACANRNKRSVAIDISRAEGADLVARLADASDVLLENYKVGGLAKYGLDAATLRARNPRLIYCSITGFGQTGPYAHRPGYDFMIQAMAGLMSVTGRPDGEAGSGPQKVGVATADILTGLYATIAILAAVQRRHATGEGQHIDMSLFDTQIAAMANLAGNHLATGQAPGRLGNAHPSIVPYQDLRTEDGFMVVAVGNDGQFARFCACLGRPEWARDARFATNRARVEHRAVLIPLIEGVTRTRPAAAWIADFVAAGVPCGPVNTLADVFADPQVEARGVRIEMAHALAGRASLVANPIRLSEAPVSYRRPPPLLGQHTDEVLREMLGLDDAVIHELRSAGAIGR